MKNELEEKHKTICLLYLSCNEAKFSWRVFGSIWNN